MIQVIRHTRQCHRGDSDSLACKHNHRSLRAAGVCARRAAIGVPSCGAIKTINIYVDGRAVEQWVEADQPFKTRGRYATWSSAAARVLPGDAQWRNVPTKHAPVKS